MIEGFRVQASARSLVALTSNLIAEIGYQQELARIYKDPQEQIARWNSVEEVVNALGSYERGTKTPSLSGFLEDTALGGQEEDRQKEKQLTRDAVMLMTLHSAKGLEFSQVYLVGMEEGLLPHHRSVAADDKSIDEERRLCYVGITRAQDRLTMSLALARQKWGKPRPSVPSRFLYEITGKADNPHLKRPVNSDAKKPGGAKKGARSP
jgi:DNA helicase-2/ATP-dependent DNA helicase PcrA